MYSYEIWYDDLLWEDENFWGRTPHPRRRDSLKRRVRFSMFSMRTQTVDCQIQIWHDSITYTMGRGHPPSFAGAPPPQRSGKSHCGGGPTAGQVGLYAYNDMAVWRRKLLTNGFSTLHFRRYLNTVVNYAQICNTPDDSCTLPMYKLILPSLMHEWNCVVLCFNNNRFTTLADIVTNFLCGF